MDDAPKFTQPSGSGGQTNTFVKNGKTITMGHGGRRQEIMNKLGLNYLEVKEAIANHVSTQNLKIGQIPMFRYLLKVKLFNIDRIFERMVLLM